MVFNVAIVGAGIVGAACAYRLAQEGLNVALVDSGDVAGGTTSAGMGHIVVMDDSDAQFALTCYSRELWNNLARSLPASCEYEFCGTVWVAADDEEMHEVRRKHDFYRSRGVAAEILDEKSLREAEPHLRHGLAGGLLVPSDSVVYQLSATRFLTDQAVELGAKLLTGRRVATVDEKKLILHNGDTIEAENIVVAAGFQTTALLKGLNIIKRKGHLVITDRYPGFVRHQLIELGYIKSAHGTETDSVAFNVQPRITGQLLIGSSRQFGAESDTVDYSILRRMLNRAAGFMPDLNDLSAVRVWTGFRPATPDNLPYIGPYRENIYVAAGHEGLGITTALGTAELLTDEIMGRESAIDRRPYSPGRV